MVLRKVSCALMNSVYRAPPLEKNERKMILLASVPEPGRRFHAVGQMSQQA